MTSTRRRLKNGLGIIDTDRVLGNGSFGMVCRAKCGQLSCAAKLLHDILVQPNDHSYNKVYRQFQEECELLSKLKHPNIVQYLGTDIDPETNRPVLLTELMDESLTKYFERSTGPLPYHTQVNICHDVALALSYLHFNDIIHRDLSSNNVLLIGGGTRAKVTDFGMSRDMRPQMTQCPGTQVYMPPEAMMFPPRYSSKLDCFSFGVLTLQILTRKFPRPAESIKMKPDPTSPTGHVLVPVPEIQRRKNDIDLIDPNHRLLAVAKSCLKDKEGARPSADALCEHLDSLKNDSHYSYSVGQRKSPNILAQHEVLTQLEEKQRIINRLQR